MEFKINTKTKIITLISGSDISDMINSLQILREIYGKDWKVEIQNDIQFIPYTIEKFEKPNYLPGTNVPLIPYVGDIIPNNDWYTISYKNSSDTTLLLSEIGKSMDGEAIYTTKIK